MNVHVSEITIENKMTWFKPGKQFWNKSKRRGWRGRQKRAMKRFYRTGQTV